MSEYEVGDKVRVRQGHRWFAGEEGEIVFKIRSLTQGAFYTVKLPGQHCSASFVAAQLEPADGPSTGPTSIRDLSDLRG